MVIKVSWVLFVVDVSSQLELRMSGHLVYVGLVVHAVDACCG